MPFTFAHPAIVLSQKNNKYLDFTSLILGTMAPDFEYFINFRPISTIGHTLIGQLYFNLPIVIFLAYLYHYIIKTAIIKNLPYPLNYKYMYLSKSVWKIDSLKRFLIVSYSAILGALSHIFWDSFTHNSAFFTNRISYLSSRLNLFNFKIPVYKILQHASTFVGFIIILIYLIKIMDNKEYLKKDIRKNKLRQTKLSFWLISIAISTSIFLLILIFMDNLLIGRLIISLINSTLLGITLSSIIYNIIYYKNKKANI